MRLVIQSNNDGEWQNDPDVSFRFAVKYTLLLGLGVLVIVYHSKLFPGVADEFVGLLKSLGVSSVLRGLNYGHLARAITGTLEGALARTPWALLTLMRSQLSSWLIAGGAVFIIVSTHKKGSSFLKNYSFGFRAYDPTRLFIRFLAPRSFLVLIFRCPSDCAPI